nr:rhomboid protein family homolog [uncultured bacterium]
MKLQCPDCSHSMDEHLVHGVTIDWCSECAGIWFDEGELKRYLESSAPDSVRVLPEELFTDLSEGENLTCPRCEDSTARFGMIDGFQFQGCNSCAGVFIGKPHIALITRRYSTAGSSDDDGSANSDITIKTAAGRILLDIVGQFVIAVFTP